MLAQGGKTAILNTVFGIYVCITFHTRSCRVYDMLSLIFMGLHT